MVGDILSDRIHKQPAFRETVKYDTLSEVCEFIIMKIRNNEVSVPQTLQATEEHRYVSEREIKNDES